MTISDYNGPERRRDWQKLDDAIKEVQRLHGTTETLANAVVNTAPKHELESLKDEVKRDFQIKVIINGILATIIIIFLTVLFTIKMNHLRKDVAKGHEVIACLLGRTEVQRTGDLAATALIACEQTTR